MHLVVDLNNDRLMVVEIGHLYPGMHGKGITGRRETILAKDLIRKSFSALELVRIIARNPVLHFNRLPMLAQDGSR
jgi:hypothetical protein